MQWGSILRMYTKHRKKAAFLLRNRKQIISLLNQATNKADKKEGYISKVWAEIQCMFRAVGAWVKGEYKDMPKSSLIAIVATLLYFVSPLDVLPDFIPLSGFLDDATVIGFAATQISKDLARFRAWEEEKTI